MEEMAEARSKVDELVLDLIGEPAVVYVLKLREGDCGAP